MTIAQRKLLIAVLALFCSAGVAAADAPKPEPAKDAKADHKDEKKDDKKDKGDKDNKDDKKDGKDKPQNSQPKPQEVGISKQRLENLLDAVNNEEKKVQDKVNKKKVKARPIKTEKDW